MTVAIQRGYTFGSTELVTNTKLHTLVDGATISGIDETVFASARGIVIVSTSAPSNTSSIWLDSNTTPPTAKLYTGSEWQPVASYGVFTNKSGGSVVAGDVVVVDTTTAGSFTTTNSANNQRALGVAMHTIANNADGVIALAGARVEVLNCNGTVGIGDFLATSTTVKQALPSATFQAGTFAIAMAARSGAGVIAEAVIIGGNAPSGYTPTAANALAGSVVQVVNVQSGAVVTGNTAMPNDDTIPQNTEGAEYLTLAITPTNASNKLKITVLFVNANSGAAATVLALFQDSTANALAASIDVAQVATSGQPSPQTLIHYMAAGTTSATTFKIRAGTAGGDTVTMNGAAGARKMGGVMASSITIEEIKV